MRLKETHYIAIVLAAIIIVMASAANNPTANVAKNVNNNINECPKLSQASLDVETKGCPSTFGSPVAEERTSWSIEKTAETPPLNNPQNDFAIYSVKVTQGPDSHILVVEGQLRITNSGEQTPTLESVVANLQKKSSGIKYSTVASAVATKSFQCRDGIGIEGGQTCFGSFQNTGSSILTLTDINNNDVTALLSTVPIPPTTDFDDDNDGQYAEDPIDGIDNDGDFIIDEDPYNICPNALIINFNAEFNLDEIPIGPQARIEILTTFAGAGGRGNSADSVSCTADANCNGIIDGDNTGTCQTNEAETNNVRTVATRNSFQIPPFTPVCPTVIKTDSGASSLNPACVQIQTTTILNTVISKQFENAMDIEEVLATASCVDGACQTDIVNTAVLSCIDGRNELIEGSPASANIPATCQEGPEPPIAVGDYCTYTQGGWGTTCSGQNPGCFRDAHFSSVFTTGIGIGEGVVCSPGNCGKTPLLNGAPLFAAKWATSSAVRDYLPAGGTPSTLTADLLNPTSTSSGVLDAQLLAATLAVGFDDAGAFPTNNPANKLGNLFYTGGTPCDGLSVRQVINIANAFTSGASSPFTGPDLNYCLTLLNEGFDECTVADVQHFTTTPPFVA